MTSITTVDRVNVDGVSVFYRKAGPSDSTAPTVLLLHGFPSSSHQFRNLIPLLAGRGYRVIAPDLPGYGFTTVPSDGKYVFNFANLATTIEGFVNALDLKKFAIYIFDYGAPTGLRLALKMPDRIAAIVSQNGNAYEEGLGANFWAPVRKYWASGDNADREALRGFTEFDATKWQYTDGSPNPELIQPESYTLDQALMDMNAAIPGRGGKEAQLDLLYDYRNNLPLYPQFHEYFRTSGVPVLAIWGKNDTIFVPPGAEAYQKDVKKFELKFLDAGHFAIETNEEEMASSMDGFFNKFNVFSK